MTVTHGTVEREVVISIGGITGAEPIIPPYGTRTIEPDTIQITYAGSGYVRINVEGHVIRRDGTKSRSRAGGYWSHKEGQSAERSASPMDTSQAPQWVRDYCERYAPGDFTSVS